MTLSDVIASLLADLEFETEGGVKLRGERFNADLGGSALSGDAPVELSGVRQSTFSAPTVRQSLAEHIYAEIHCKVPRSTLRRVHVTDRIANRDFLRALSRANGTERAWERGWSVASVAHDGVSAVERRAVRFAVSPGAVRANGVTAPGEQCSVQVGGEQRNMIPGFYLALGEETPDVAPERQVRVYWHLRNSGAVPLLKTLSASLNAAGIPFWLKLLNDPAAYSRTDAAVLYLPLEVGALAVPLILNAYDTIRGHIRVATSPFVLTIGPGLGVATDLVRSASFGQHRSDALAAAVVTAAGESLGSAVSLTSARVLDAFRRQGINPAAPFRHADDEDPAGWDAWHKNTHGVAVRNECGADRSSLKEDLKGRALQVANEIADWLCREAYVHDRRWNWMGSDVGIDDDSAELVSAYRALGPSLYDGTSGPALFLAEAFAATQRSQFADGARGALRHAFARAASTPSDTRLGFHTGVVGIAWAASRIGKILEDQKVTKQARELALQIGRETSPPPLLDVISGAAGTAVALLTLAEHLSLEELRDSARRLGAAICVGASRSDSGWSWGANASGTAHERNLTGFAHGAGGIGWSLLELGDALGVREFVAGAREAMRYENQWYSQEEENWPDFRESDGVDSPAPYMMAWCHGAPGIILSRLRAHQVLGEPQFTLDLSRAVRAAARWLSDPDVAVESSYTLCHGQLGVAECVLSASSHLGDETARDAALATAMRGIAAHSGRPEAWVPGIRRGRNPSMMLGQTGIGYFYLRLATPRAPSVLFWPPSEVTR